VIGKIVVLWRNHLSRSVLLLNDSTSRRREVLNFRQTEAIFMSPLEEESGVIKIALYPSQARPFETLLPDARNRTGITGVLCTVNKVLDLNDGRLLLELQAARLDRQTTLKVRIWTTT
jgi:hypothetical protein